MELTEREAARRISARHLLSRGQAMRVLKAGLAGTPRPTTIAHYYNAARVEALVSRPRCSEDILDRLHPFIARAGRSRTIGPGMDWAATAAVFAPNWKVPLTSRVWLYARSPLGADRAPFVGVLGGWVVFGAEIVGMRRRPGDSPGAGGGAHGPGLDWILEPPGEWFTALRDTWLPIDNCPTWTIWGKYTDTRSTADSLTANYFREQALVEALRQKRSRARKRTEAFQRESDQ